VAEDEAPRTARHEPGPNGGSQPGAARPATARFNRRPAGPKDRPFAERLYLEVMRPLLEELGEWDEAALVQHFRKGYRREEVSLVVQGRSRIGWLQVTEQPDSLMLSQIHLVRNARNRGIGSALLRDLMARADRERRPVMLWVVKNNPARQLYERLGFRVVGAESYKLRMEWTPPSLDVNRSSPDPAS
jgi:ribosomal protein S18 acetylase RimI-like enzyme